MNDLPERFDLASKNPVADRLNAFAALFPEVMQEGKVDVDALRRSLGEWVDPGPERFGLTWPGKAECMRVIQEPSIGTLVPMREESVDWDTTQNVIIEGENLEVLKLLQKAYYGKVKLIYIDPPYNTGKEFIYPDNFKEGLADYLRYSGQVDEEGFKLSANAETDGRYHSKWLSMMYPRLFLARNLLREDGVIFVSIDDHEVHNLRALMNELFGEENFIANVVWEKKYTRANDAQYFSDNHDHILVFARSAEHFSIGGLPKGEKQLGAYSNPDGHPKGVWKATPLHAKSGRNSSSFTFANGVTFTPPPGTFRRYSDDEMTRLESANEIWFGKGGLSVPSRKSFADEVKQTMTPVTIWPHSVAGHNHEANDELKKLGMGGAFSSPKPTRLLRLIMTIAAVDDGDIVLDFFAGSGTTGHAVLDLNASDALDRKYILVQLPEPTEQPKLPTIASMTRERVRRAAAQIKATLVADAPDLGFRSYCLSRSNFTIWEMSAMTADAVAEQLAMSVEHVVEGAAEHAILNELLLKAGYPLTSQVEEVDFAGVLGYAVAEGALLVCLSSDLSIEAFEAMVEREPAMILVLDAGFGGSDELKVNALQTVRARNQQSGGDIALRVV